MEHEAEDVRGRGARGDRDGRCGSWGSAGQAARLTATATLSYHGHSYVKLRLLGGSADASTVPVDFLPTDELSDGGASITVDVDPAA